MGLETIWLYNKIKNVYALWLTHKRPLRSRTLKSWWTWRKKNIISIITEWVTHFILQWRSGEAKKILNMKTLFLKYAQEMVLVVFVDEKITEYLWLRLHHRMKIDDKIFRHWIGKQSITWYEFIVFYENSPYYLSLLAFITLQCFNQMNVIYGSFHQHKENLMQTLCISPSLWFQECLRNL